MPPCFVTKLPSCPKTLVAPTNGAERSQTLVHIVEVYPHNHRFSGETISVVQVIKIESKELIDIFEAIEVTINSTTLSNGVTELRE